MSAKTSHARTEAFFTALAETGNQTISAERARVSRSWVTLHRSTDSAFKARMEAATGEARENLARVASQAPAAAWGDIDGEQLVVRGTNGRLVQVARARLGQWTPDVERRFLRTLAATCNVKAACAEVSMSPASAYNRRHRLTAFAAHWDQALQIGSWRLQAALLQSCCNMMDGVEVDADAPIPPMTVDEAIRYVGLHRRQLAGFKHRRWHKDWYKLPDIDEVRASIVRKVEVIKRHREAERKGLPDFLKE